MDMFDHDDVYVTIARYLAGETTPDETAALQRILEQSEDVRRDFFALKDLWHALHPAFDGSEVEIEAAERRILARTGIARPRRNHRWLDTFRRVSAVLLLPVAAIAVYLAVRDAGRTHIPEYSISAAYGYTVETELPDGSHVWLNANSTLRYPASFADNERSRACAARDISKCMPTRSTPSVSIRPTWLWWPPARSSTSTPTDAPL